MKPKIRALLFDKDGTLFDFSASFAPWVNETLSALAKGDASKKQTLADAVGFDLERADFAPESVIIAGTPSEIVDDLIPHLPDYSYDQLLAFLVDTSVDAPQAEAVPLRPLFARFRAAGLKLGISTNDAELPARAHLRSAKVEEMFDFISGFDSGFGFKPEPGMQIAFSKAMGLAPDEIAMVGDSTHDLIAGRSAGMITIAVLTGIAREAELAPYADHVLPNIGHLPEFLGLD